MRSQLTEKESISALLIHSSPLVSHHRRHVVILQAPSSCPPSTLSLSSLTNVIASRRISVSSPRLTETSSSTARFPPVPSLSIAPSNSTMPSPKTGAKTTVQPFINPIAGQPGSAVTGAPATVVNALAADVGVRATQPIAGGVSAYVQAQSTVVAVPTSLPPPIMASTPTLGAGINYGPATAGVSAIPGQPPTFGFGATFRF